MAFLYLCLNSYFIRCILINQLRINYWIIFARCVIFNLFLWIIVKTSKLISLPAHLSLHRWKYKRINLFFTLLLLHIRAIICKIKMRLGMRFSGHLHILMELSNHFNSGAFCFWLLNWEYIICLKVLINCLIHKLFLVG